MAKPPASDPLNLRTWLRLPDGTSRQGFTTREAGAAAGLTAGKRSEQLLSRALHGFGYAKRRGNAVADRTRRWYTDSAPAAGREDALIKKLTGAEGYGTPLQRVSLQALLEQGSIAAAAAALQLSPATLRAHLDELERRAARAGWSPGCDMTKPVPAGYHVKGVSTYYDGDGVPRGQWVKSAADPDNKLAQLMEAIQTLAEPLRGLHEATPAPEHERRYLDYAAADLLNVVPIGDPHFGMFAWAAETGDNFDLKIAERDLIGAVDHLMQLAPPADECLIINAGDFFHADNSSNQTARSHHALDVDGRWAKVLGVGISAMRRCVDRALEHHKRVTVICEIGNHDDHSAQMLAICLASYYEREPRVTVDTSPAKYHWYRFGANLIGTTHGDTIKHDKLGQIMATDRPRDWGETQHRRWYVGHVHHDSVKEVPGCTIETLRTLAARDAWHAAAGYRSGRDLKLDVIHREYGQITRHVVGVPQLRAQEARA